MDSVGAQNPRREKEAGGEEGEEEEFRFNTFSSSFRFSQKDSLILSAQKKLKKIMTIKEL